MATKNSAPLLHKPSRKPLRTSVRKLADNPAPPHPAAGKPAPGKAATKSATTKTPAQSATKVPTKKAAKSTVRGTAGLDARTMAQAHPFAEHDLGVAVPYLLARAGERMGNTFSREIRPFKLTLNEWRACVALHLQPHQRLSEIAAHTSADLSTLSRVMDGLLRRGLVQRDRESGDARAFALSLTDEGRLLTEKIIPIAQLYERVALSGISEEEATQLRRLLSKVYENIGILNGGG